MSVRSGQSVYDFLLPPDDPTDGEDPLARHRRWLEENLFSPANKTKSPGELVSNEELLTAITPQLSLLGGPVGVAGGIADVEAQAALEDREPEAWERGLAGLGAIPAVGGTMRKISHPAVKEIINLLRHTPMPGRNRPGFKTQEDTIGTLNDWFTQSRSPDTYEKPAASNYHFKANANPLESLGAELTYLGKNIVDDLHVNDLMERLKGTPKVFNQLKDVFDQSNDAVTRSSPELVSALETYLRSSDTGLKEMGGLPIEQFENMKSVSGALLNWLGIDNPTLYRVPGRVPGRPVRGISYSDDPQIDKLFTGKDPLWSGPVPNREILTSHILSPNLIDWRRYNKEREWIRLPEDLLPALRKATPTKTLGDFVDIEKRTGIKGNKSGLFDMEKEKGDKILEQLKTLADGWQVADAHKVAKENPLWIMSYPGVDQQGLISPSDIKLAKLKAYAQSQQYDDELGPAMLSDLGRIKALLQIYKKHGIGNPSDAHMWGEPKLAELNAWIDAIVKTDTGKGSKYNKDKIDQAEKAALQMAKDKHWLQELKENDWELPGLIEDVLMMMKSIDDFPPGTF